ncbi:hypothetical protein SUDANB21_00014 [Streptomyces sp. enrichment culture]|uniref:hypothetical protein n=1 Tax=Streptomyces sp. enrichment culture TaxID=1795815 RepID=UPI003F55C4FC
MTRTPREGRATPQGRYEKEARRSPMAGDFPIDATICDGDPASELHTWYGRFHYFRPDELEPLEIEPLEPARSPGRAAVTGSRRTPEAATTDSETPSSGGR